MIDLHKIKRQIEIVGMCIDHSSKIDTLELSIQFKCDELTIKRDLRNMRSYGIPIHSIRGRGVCIDPPLSTSLLRQLVIQYSALSNYGTSIDRATNLLVKSQKGKAVAYMVALQQCIEQERNVMINYLKEADKPEDDMEVSPLQILQTDGYIRLLALHGREAKLYHLNKLRKVMQTDRKFKRPPQEEIDTWFTNSFRSWLGTEVYQVKLSLSKSVANRMKPTQLLYSQKLIENPNGTAILEATVNSLEEIAGWVISRGDGVQVLEPVKLKEMVISLAEGALRNYQL